MLLLPLADIIDDGMFTQYSWAFFQAASQMFCIGYGAILPIIVQEVTPAFFELEYATMECCVLCMTYVKRKATAAMHHRDSILALS